MNYELAKKLKDAGFPESKDSALVGKSVTIDDWISPHLSELIEACGEEFGSLNKRFGVPVEDDGLIWIARAQSSESELAPYERRGPTPEEAVARLWLVLNKKENV